MSLQKTGENDQGVEGNFWHPVYITKDISGKKYQVSYGLYQSQAKCESGVEPLAVEFFNIDNPNNDDMAQSTIEAAVKGSSENTSLNDSTVI